MNMSTTQESPRIARRQRRQKQLDNTLAASSCDALLGVTVLGSVLAVGTVHVEALLAVSFLALLGGGLAMLSIRRVPKPAIVLAGLGLISLLQAIPLPATWASALSPPNSRVWLHSLDPFAEPAPTHFPLSLDGGASIAEALKWFTYAAVYVMALRVRRRRSPAWLATLVFGSAVLVAAITLVHGAAEIPELYGLYEPHFTPGRWSVGPLLNSNNFAGYANLGLFAGVGLLLTRSRSLPPLPVLAGLSVIATALLLSGSRAGMAGAVAGLALVGLWLIRKQRLQFSFAKALIVTVPVLLAALAFFTLSSTEELQRFATADTQRKLAVWRWTLPMIRDHLWFGVGRGAFETALPPYRLTLADDWTAVHSHAENFVLQWLSEWGIVVGSCAVITVVGYVASELYGARRERLRLLLLAGVGVVLLQNLADLGLEIPSLMIAAVVALVAGERSRKPLPAPEQRTALIGAVGTGSVLIIVWLCAAEWSLWPVEDERRQATIDYRQLSLLDVDERAMFRDELHSAMMRHPGEAHFPLLGAVVAFRSGTESPLPWLNRALELGPTNGRVHLALAEMLAAHRATSQAILHLRLALEYDQTLSGAVATLLVQWAPTLDVLLQGIPRTPRGTVVLGGTCELVKEPNFRVACFREAVARNPREPRSLRLLAESLLHAVRSDMSPCRAADKPACHAEVERLAQAMTRVNSGAWQAGYVLAKNYEAMGDPAKAAVLLAKTCPGGNEGQQCSRDSVMAAIASRSDAAISNAAKAFAARTCDANAACAASLDWLGSSLDAAGKGALALSYFTKAAEVESTADRWLRVAQRASTLGLPGIARPALDRANRSPDASFATRAAVSRLRSDIARASPLGL